MIALLTQLGSAVRAVHEGQAPTRTGIDSDPDPTDRQPSPGGDARRSTPFRMGLATEGTEFTERFFILPSTRQPSLHLGCFQMGKDLRLCDLGDLCGRNRFPSRPRFGQWSDRSATIAWRQRQQEHAISNGLEVARSRRCDYHGPQSTFLEMGRLVGLRENRRPVWNESGLGTDWESWVNWDGIAGGRGIE